MFDSQLEWTNEWIEKDVRNNSVWNFRFWVLDHVDFDVETEVKFVMDWIDRVPGNESTWNYLLGLTKKYKLSPLEKHSTVPALQYQLEFADSEKKHTELKTKLMNLDPIRKSFYSTLDYSSFGQ